MTSSNHTRPKADEKPQRYLAMREKPWAEVADELPLDQYALLHKLMRKSQFAADHYHGRWKRGDVFVRDNNGNVRPARNKTEFIKLTFPEADTEPKQRHYRRRLDALVKAGLLSTEGSDAGAFRVLVKCYDDVELGRMSKADKTQPNAVATQPDLVPSQPDLVVGQPDLVGPQPDLVVESEKRPQITTPNSTPTVSQHEYNSIQSVVSEETTTDEGKEGLSQEELKSAARQAYETLRAEGILTADHQRPHGSIVEKFLDVNADIGHKFYDAEEVPGRLRGFIERHDSTRDPRPKLSDDVLFGPPRESEPEPEFVPPTRDEVLEYAIASCQDHELLRLVVDKFYEHGQRYDWLDRFTGRPADWQAKFQQRLIDRKIPQEIERLVQQEQQQQQQQPERTSDDAGSESA